MAHTQSALYAKIDLDLSWSEGELPERERTKHVHRLHPYLGKFMPQLVEVLLAGTSRPAGSVLDPFAGSGTTLVEALESGHDAAGADVSAFNCLLMRVKTAPLNEFVLEQELRDASRRIASGPDTSEATVPDSATRLVRAAGARRAARLAARSTSTSTPTCCASSCPAPPARPGGPRTRPRLPRPRHRALLVPQAPPRVPPRRRCRPLPAPLRAPTPSAA